MSPSTIPELLALRELTNGVRKRCGYAPGQFAAVSEDVTKLSNTLRDIQAIEPELNLSAAQRAHLTDLSRNTRCLLDDVIQLLDKDQVLGLGASSEDEIADLHTRLEKSRGVFHAFSTGLNTGLALDAHRKQHRQLLDWVDPTPHAALQADVLSLRHDGTGTWLLHEASFQRWVEETSSSSRTLYAHGVSGAGKTVLTAIAVDYLQGRARTTASSSASTSSATSSAPDALGVAHLYCDSRREEREQCAEHLLSGLLKQAMEQSRAEGAIPDGIKDLYKKRTRPSLQELCDSLRQVAGSFATLYLAVDALDECIPLQRRRFLSALSALQDDCPSVKVLATSRPLPEITALFTSWETVEIRASDEDISAYVAANLEPLRPHSPEQENDIVSSITKAAEGRFLLSRLHLESLSRSSSSSSPSDLQSALSQLPSGPDAYDAAYNASMQHIEAQDAPTRELARLALLWITCAARPLTTTELQRALAIELSPDTPHDPTPTPQNPTLPDPAAIMASSAGLISISPNTQTIRLLHVTAHAFFQRPALKEAWFPDAQPRMTHTTTSYLLTPKCGFSAGATSTDEAYEARLLQHPLYSYAATFWGHHAKASGTDEHNELILTLLMHSEKCSSCAQALMISLYQPKPGGTGTGYSQDVPRGVKNIHLAAYFGLDDAVKALIQRVPHIDCKDTHGQTALIWAAKRDHHLVAEMLIENGADPETKDIYGRTPLAWASVNGCEAVIGVLLNYTEPEVTSHSGRTALGWAAERGHALVAQKLLAGGACPDSRDLKYGRTPLAWASEKGHEEVVRLLLGEGAAADSTDRDGRNPLSLATIHGCEGVVRLMLRAGADPDCRDKARRTPLMHAARTGQESLVRLFLSRGADPTSTDNDGRTALCLAAWNGYDKVVELLGEMGAHPDVRDFYGRSPLSLAAWRGHEAVAKLLVAKGVETDFSDFESHTPLELAEKCGHQAVASLLLDVS